MEFASITDVKGLKYETIAQPERVEFYFADEVFVKQIAFGKSGVMVPGHAHVYDHTSFIAAGSIRIWADDKLLGDFKAPIGIWIKANVKHMMMSLEDGAVLYCVHNTHGYALDELEEHLVLEKNTATEQNP